MDRLQVDLISLDREDVAFDLLQERVLHYLQVLKTIETDLPCALSVGRRYLVQMSGLKSVLKNKIASIIERLLGRFSQNFTASATKYNFVSIIYQLVLMFRTGFVRIMRNSQIWH